MTEHRVRVEKRYVDACRVYLDTYPFDDHDGAFRFAMTQLDASTPTYHVTNVWVEEWKPGEWVRVPWPEWTQIKWPDRIAP